MSIINEWISTNDALPKNGQKVLIYTGDISIATFKRGISWEDREKMDNGEIANPCLPVYGNGDISEVRRSQVFAREDAFNGSGNTVPYYWYVTHDEFNPRGYHGQDVTHWMPMPEPPNP